MDRCKCCGSEINLTEDDKIERMKRDLENSNFTQMMNTAMLKFIADNKSPGGGTSG